MQITHSAIHFGDLYLYGNFGEYKTMAILTRHGKKPWEVKAKMAHGIKNFSIASSVIMADDTKRLFKSIGNWEF